MDSLHHDSLHDRTAIIRQWTRWLLLLVFTVALVGAVYPLDLVLSRLLARLEIWPGDTRRIVAMAEYVAHGSGVLVILAVIWLLDPHKRRFLPRVAASAYFGGLVANILKTCAARRRPLMTDASVLDVNITWANNARGIPVGADGYWDYDWQSFPSAHAATAIGFAIGLSWLYPKGKYLFWGMAFLAGLQRVVFMAHWPTDVLVGVCLGIISGFCFTIQGTLGNRIFAAWESRCQRTA